MVRLLDGLIVILNSYNYQTIKQSSNQAIKSPQHSALKFQPYATLKSLAGQGFRQILIAVVYENGHLLCIIEQLFTFHV